MLSIVVWIVMGACVGWIASLLLKTDEAPPHPVGNVAASVAGAVIGGLVARALGYGSGFDRTFSFQSVLFAVLGASILMFAYNLAVGLRRDAPR